MVIFNSKLLNYQRVTALKKCHISWPFSVMKSEQVYPFFSWWSWIQSPYFLRSSECVHTMWPPPSDVSWFRFAPVTSSLFAYHVYHSEIGVMWTPTERYLQLCPLTVINGIINPITEVIYHEILPFITVSWAITVGGLTTCSPKNPIRSCFQRNISDSSRPWPAWPPCSQPWRPSWCRHQPWRRWPEA